MKKFFLLFLFSPVFVVQAQTISLGSEALEQGLCRGGFVEHQLEHLTLAHDPANIGAYDSNGAGVAVGDLDNDSDLDLVFANLKGNNSIFWNEGDLHFRKEELSHGDSRAVSVIDIDGNGWLDIAFTQSLSSPILWYNQGGKFERVFRSDLSREAYSMAWADLDQDNDLDLVTGSYNALLEKELRDRFMFSSGAGVVVYEQTQEGFKETRLIKEAQALALILFDINNDGKLDILVGNDFAIPDYAYLNSDGEWLEANPFTTTSRNTMSFDAADVDNNGYEDLFSTDMKPDFRDPRTLAAWMPLMQKTYELQKANPVQRVENALQLQTAQGFSNDSYKLRLDASGWSWSGKFGDLNNDGLLDLYIVNGMIDNKVLSHLPDNELVEQNLAFQNLGHNQFVSVDWSLGSVQSGRGMTMADLDNDGDLDIVVNNLESPSILFENQFCGDALELDLSWNSLNTRAIGAKLILHTSKGKMMREIRSNSGYLSGDSARVHFGLAKNTQLQSLEIIWPDGFISTLTTPEINSLTTIYREDL